MLGIGLWELAVVLAVALVALGPERIKSAAERAGRLFGKAGRGLDELRSNLDLADDGCDPHVDDKRP